jgi:hypothetical protein
MDKSDAMIIAVGDENLDVIHCRIKDAADPTWLVKARIESLLISQGGLSVSKPGEDLIIEGVYYLDLMIIGICHSYHVFVGYKANT